jgi:2-oxoglutarate dehydrogenase E2 component (dihydrolipoamide succinyltransferase)
MMLKVELSKRKTETKKNNMIIEIKIPTPGESITEVEIANWIVKDGDIVQKGEDLFEVESEKATLNVTAEEGGKIQILVTAHSTIKVGEIACKIDTSFIPEVLVSEKKQLINEIAVKEEFDTDTKHKIKSDNEKSKIKITPLAKKAMDEKGLSIDDVINGLRRIWKNDIDSVTELKTYNEAETIQSAKIEKYASVSREIREEKMSMLRKKLSERLVSVKNETAMLTTFNEVDMSAVIDIRKKYQDKFVKKYDVKIGFISFFVKAATQSLMLFPEVNAMLDNENIRYHNYADIGIAVQSKKGLMVPILRNTETMSLADIELQIKVFGQKGMENKLTLDEITGGTFTITNGGTFGSLLSTPIINPPQSAILGMHNIVERPMAVNGKVEIRPMMYIALSYDHRIIDGKSAVSFLVKIKEIIENPIKIIFEGRDTIDLLLGL